MRGGVYSAVTVSHGTRNLVPVGQIGGHVSKTLGSATPSVAASFVPDYRLHAPA